MSLWFLLSERAPLARLSYAVHRALADPARPLREISFLRAMVFRSFVHLMPGDDEQAPDTKPDPSSLIVRPD